jgi:hypothetical protein
MNIDKDFTFQTIKLAPDYRRSDRYVNFFKSQPRKRKSVLYLHGYNDYFFHTHVAENSMKTTLIFMRLTWGNTADPSEKSAPHYCKDIEEYFEEISIAKWNRHDK